MNYFTIFGNPVSHSKSPLMHNLVFKKLNIDGCYTKTFLENGNDIIKIFKKLHLKGANVTVPHKENAFRLCDEVRGVAKKIGAVNTLILENGKVIGYNTDADGFMEAIKDFNYKKVLILGAGGTAKALSIMLPNAHILNRSESKLKYFKEQGRICFSWENFKIDNYDLIINSTSAGLKDNKLPIREDILKELFKTAKYAVDVIYNNTPFQELAKNSDLIIKDGSHMLVYQGVLAFEKFIYPQNIVRKEVSKIMFEAISL